MNRNRPNTLAAMTLLASAIGAGASAMPDLPFPGLLEPRPVPPPEPQDPATAEFYLRRAQERRERRALRKAENARRTEEGKRR